MTIITCSVHANAETAIEVQALRTPYCGVNTIQFDGLHIFAQAPELRRLADALSARLAIIDAEAMQVVA